MSTGGILCFDKIRPLLIFGAIFLTILLNAVVFSGEGRWKALVAVSPLFLFVIVFIFYLTEQFLPERLSQAAQAIFARLTRVAITLLVLIWLSVFLLLQVGDFWGKLLFAFAVVAFLYCILRTLSFSPDPFSFEERKTVVQPSFWWGSGVVTASAVLYAVMMSWVTIIRHYSFHSAAFDLAIQENVFWNSLHGKPFFSSVMNNIDYLGNHVVLTYSLLLPLYALLPTTETLLVSQSVLLAAAAIPLYLIGYKLTNQPFAAAALAISYLIHPALQGGNYFDFHELAFAPLLFLTAVWAFITRRRVVMWTAFALLFGVKEDCSLLVLLFSVVLLLHGCIKDAVKIGAVALLAFSFSQYLVIPAFAGHHTSYAWYFEGATPSSTLTDLLMALWVSPFEVVYRFWVTARAEYLVFIFLPVVLVPLLSSHTIPLVLYGIGLAVFSSHAPLYTPGFHYAFLILPGAYLGTALQLRSLRRSRVVVVTAIVLGSGFMYLGYGAPFPIAHFIGGFQRLESVPLRLSQDEGAVRLRSEVAMVEQMFGSGVSIVADENLVPHFSRRRGILGMRSFGVGDGLGYDLCVRFWSGEGGYVTGSSAERCRAIGCWGSEAVVLSGLIVCKR
jgi:uncharacterized membrane protein